MLVSHAAFEDSGLKLVALVPMRDHSQRVPGKNYRPLAGVPLFHHVLRTLEAVPEISRIVVDTDSRTIADGLQRDFPAVQLVWRPEHLRGDAVPMNDILLHDVEQVPADIYLQTHSTNPLLQSGTISRAIQTFLDGRPAHDTLFSVTRLQSRFYDAHGGPINHDPAELIQTQDLPPVFEENSCIYLFPAAILRDRHHRVGTSPQLFEIPANEAWDIDEELDFEICEFLLRRAQGKSAPGGASR